MDDFLTGGQARASKDGDWSETCACNLFDWYLENPGDSPLAHRLGPVDPGVKPAFCSIT